MFAKLRNRLAVPTRAVRPSSLYSTHSSADSDSMDHDSVHSEPSDLFSHDDIYSPVTYGAEPYEVAVPLAQRGQNGALEEATYDTVEYCNSYDIYEEYGFDELYEPIEYENTEVHTYMYMEDLVSSTHT